MSTWPSPPSQPEIPPPPDVASLLTLRVVLDGTEPEVWRRLMIPGDLLLDCVHDVLQQVMGWTDSHLHQFSLGPPYVSPKFLTAYDIEEGDEGAAETDVRLDQVLREPGDELTYEYDFGDGWTHTIVLEQVERQAPDAGGDAEAKPGRTAYAIACLAGERACPPENIGGVPGYEEVAEWVRGGEDPAHVPNGLTSREMRAWLPTGWHPDEFDLEDTNAALARLAPRDTAAAMGQLPAVVADVISRLRGAVRLDLDEWLSAPTWGAPDHFTPEEAAGLTVPFRVVLDAVGDGLTLTPAGYLPPRVVEHVLHGARLAEHWPGQGNREDLTPPVLDLRERVRRYGLLRKAKGRLLPTSLAARLRDDPVRLLDHVLSRLAADGREWEQIAGGLLLVSVVGGEPLELRPRATATAETYDRVTHLLSVAGFRPTDGGFLARGQVERGGELHLGAVATLLSCVDSSSEGDAADLTRRVALAVLHRMR
ncbi:plasmid pRiA4b ORF-3 family protein [Terrabacter sp. 2RAF25]|uniref:plasmid pRiA4b ORF-3 family protein n=1 Tax=Terrabacter sp. 2RAF25 TaxID=3232998 RepID=UPI003F95BE4A